MMDEIRCRVCGWVLAEPPWGEDGRSPSYEICSCCGCEFGYEDCRASGILTYRKKWIDSGGVWFSPKDKPEGWSLEDQLKQIPEELPAGIHRND